MAFNANEKRKEDIENAIKIIADCIEMFKPLKEGKAKMAEIDIQVIKLEKDMDTMSKSFEQYESSEAKSILDMGGATLRRAWEELLPQRNELRYKVKELEENIKEYLLYLKSFAYIDDDLLKWIFEKATADSVKDVEFFAILLILSSGYVGNDYEDIVKSYAYKAKHQYIVEHLLEHDVTEICEYIACQKIQSQD